MEVDKISVVIPLYNQGQYLSEAVQSVLQQSIQAPIEIIIVDDKSTDNSRQVASDLVNQLRGPIPIQLICNEQNAKLSATRNIGVRYTTGKLIVCLDADDILPSNYLLENYNTLLSGFDVAYTDMRYFGDVNTYLTLPEYDEYKLRSTNFIHCSAMYRRSMWEAIKGYDEDMVLGLEDWAFWIRAARLGYKFKKTPGTCLHYRRHAGNMLQSTKKNYPTICKQLKGKFGDWMLLPTIT